VRYRKKPIEIEAVRYDGANTEEIAAFMAGEVERATLPGPGRGLHEGIIIHTLEGDMPTSVGDWIIRGVQGEFYPCKPDIFEQTHEPVGDDHR
jgi:hypothetical protein